MVCGRDYHGSSEQGGCGHSFDWSRTPALDADDAPSASAAAASALDTRTPYFDLSSLSPSSAPPSLACAQCNELIVGTCFSCARCEPVADDGRIIVSGAGGNGMRCNGAYVANGTHNGRPLYAKAGAPRDRERGGRGGGERGEHAIIYWSEAWRPSWKLNASGSTGGWIYSLEPTTAGGPPLGAWTSGGYGGTDCLPCPTASKGDTGARRGPTLCWNCARGSLAPAATGTAAISGDGGTAAADGLGAMASSRAPHAGHLFEVMQPNTFGRPTVTLASVRLDVDGGLALRGLEPSRLRRMRALLARQVYGVPTSPPELIGSLLISAERS